MAESVRGRWGCSDDATVWRRVHSGGGEEVKGEVDESRAGWVMIKLTWRDHVEPVICRSRDHDITLIWKYIQLDWDPVDYPHQQLYTEVVYDEGRQAFSEWMDVPWVRKPFLIYQSCTSKSKKNSQNVMSWSWDLQITGCISSSSPPLWAFLCIASLLLQPYHHTYRILPPDRLETRAAIIPVDQTNEACRSNVVQNLGHHPTQADCEW